MHTEKNGPGLPAFTGNFTVCSQLLRAQLFYLRQKNVSAQEPRSNDPTILKILYDSFNHAKSFIRRIVVVEYIAGAADQV